MCYSSERFRRVASIIYFIYDSINCPTTVSEGGGGRLISRSFSMLGTLDLFTCIVSSSEHWACYSNVL